MRVRVGVHSISFLKYRFQFSVWLYFISVFWFVSCPYLNTYIYIYTYMEEDLSCEPA